MNSFGIIKQCQRQKFFKIPKIIESTTHTILELPFTIEQMQTVKEHKLRKVTEKGIRKLRQAGIHRAILTNTLKKQSSLNLFAPPRANKNIARREEFRVIDGSLLFFDFAPKMVEWLCEKYGLEVPDIKISIKERNLSGISRNLIEKLCYQSKYMRVETADIFSAKRYADFLIEQFGFMLEISDIAEPRESNSADILIDVDNYFVQAPGKCAIDGLTIDNIEIEDTDLFDVLACLGLTVHDVKINKWKSGNIYIDITD